MLVRPHVLDLQPVVHGSVAAAELAHFGLTLAQALDFSVNTNPLGPAPGVLRAIQDTDWTRYPGDDEAPLRNGLAQQTGLTPENVGLGNGSAELLWLIALAVLESGDRVVVVGPTFGEYARAARTVGAHVTEVHALDGVPPARMVFVCNPNNPTGDFHQERDIEELLRAQPERLVVLDEAYAAFMAERWSSEALLARHRNLVILRSLTKDHALPGLRLGYLLARSEVARAVEAVRPPWSVNAGALRAGLATLEPDARTHVVRARAGRAVARPAYAAPDQRWLRGTSVLRQLRAGRRRRGGRLSAGAAAARDRRARLHLLRPARARTHRLSIARAVSAVGRRGDASPATGRTLNPHLPWHPSVTIRAPCQCSGRS
jgi:histidinol-phosphate/aromatic aminotransferase/cobyric acid decarboxylase-like protein